MFSIEMLPANEGDALWVEYGDPAAPHRILIDCGYKSTYREVMKRLDEDPDLKFELFVLTHIDGDHIAGAVPFVGDQRVTPARVREVWFNGWEHISDMLGAVQGEYFTHFLTERGFAWNTSFQGRPVMVGTGQLPVFELPGGMRLTLLSPRRSELVALADHWNDEIEEVLRGRNLDGVDELLEEVPAALRADDALGPPNVEALAGVPFEGDDKPPNGSSIAFLAEYQDTFDGNREKAVLFTGDAFAPVVVDSIGRLLQERGLGRLPITALKVSHHGSMGNTSSELLSLLECKTYLISTNGSKHSHPDPECIARILKRGRGSRLYFNYDTDLNKMWKHGPLQQDYRFTAHYPEQGEKGLRVTL